MEQETLEKFAKREAEKFLKNGGSFTSLIILGAKWQQEIDRDFYFKYIKSEKDFQIPRMDKLGINTTGQMFEQMVTSLIHLAERSYSAEEVLEHLNHLIMIPSSDLDKFTNEEEMVTMKWFEQFKKE